MKTILFFIGLLGSVFFLSCSSSKNMQVLTKKYAPAELQKDYVVFRNILEKKHPSLYWYTSKDSMDYFFNRYYSAIKDSMTEPDFAWHILSPVVEKIKCGHTSVSYSKNYVAASKNKRMPSFPLYMKVWSDSMAVIGKLNRTDTIFKRGTLITSINGKANAEIINDMFGYLPQDGNAININYARLSANFPLYHRNIYGLSQNYTVTYIDSNQTEQTIEVPLHEISKAEKKQDSINRVKEKKEPKLPRKERLKFYRDLQIDSTKTFATLTVNSFTKGNMRSFFRQSFRKLKQEKIKNLVIDIRNNGGGRVGLSTLLTKYLADSKFKVADTISTLAKKLGPYTKYTEKGILQNLQLFFMTRKKKDGRYHLRFLETKWYHPKKKNHYDGKVYVIIAGPTFSASTLFCNTLKGQENVTLVGEETGGGSYGNNGIMIPDVTLPYTRVRFRLPFYRLIQFKHGPKNGRGVIPDIYVETDYEALIERRDKKMEVVKELIFKNP